LLWTPHGRARVAGVWVANQALDDILTRRQSCFTATVSSPIDVSRYHRTQLAIGQRLKILSLTFLFSDLKDS